MAHCTEVFVGIDVSKMRNAIADGERGGEVRYFGEVDASPESMRRLVKRLATQHERLHFCYEAGPTGYGPAPPHHRPRPFLHGGRALADPQKAR